MNRRRLLVHGTAFLSPLLAGCSINKSTDEIKTFRVESSIKPLETTEKYVQGQPDLSEITLWAKLLPTAKSARQNLYLSRLQSDDAHRITTEYKDAVWVVLVAVLPNGQFFNPGRPALQDGTLIYPNPERTGSITDADDLRYVYIYEKILRTIPFTDLPSDVTVSIPEDES
ncbi:hypothetical protein [Haladaptatus sp. NG-SE-30]